MAGAVNFVSVLNKIRPKDHIDVLRSALPPRYSPLQGSGNGIQSVYLTDVPMPLAELLMGLIGKEAALLNDRASRSMLQTPMQQVENADLEMWEHHIESEIESDYHLLETEREALIVARRGQGLFKQRVMKVENRCRITGVTNPTHLRASHCKPWRDSSNEERINGENGLLLTPTIDHLFDRGFISFEDSGVLIVSPVAHVPSLTRMGVATNRVVNVGTFTEGQKQFLDYHRESVLLRARH
jgi:putative restriction endonuclease